VKSVAFLRQEFQRTSYFRNQFGRANTSLKRRIGKELQMNRIRIFSRALIALAVLGVLIGVIFADGDSRKATPAEKEFNKTVLGAIAKAVAVDPAGWEKTGGTTLEELKVVYTDANVPLRLEYHLEWQDTKRIMEAEAKYAEEIMKLTKKPGFTGEGTDELQRKMEAHDVRARIDVLTNISSQGINEKVAPAPAIAGGLVYRSESGFKPGWREGSAYIFLGNGWKMAGSYVNFTSDKKAASSTIVQNIVVKIQADAKRADQMIQKIDWGALKGLINN
jgi:hypothetical protein